MSDSGIDNDDNIEIPEGRARPWAKYYLIVVGVLVFQILLYTWMTHHFA